MLSTLFCEMLYYLIAKKKISVFSPDFSFDYFNKLINENKDSLSLKAFLATEQRIPGFGNGLCQDVLWKAHLHPKTKLNQLTSKQINDLFASMKNNLDEIINLGGRDIERDLFGNKGGYETKMSQTGIKNGCPECESFIIKKNYLGGSIYFCPKCQNKIDAK